MAGANLPLFKPNFTRLSASTRPTDLTTTTTQNLTYWDTIHSHIHSHLKKAIPIREPLSVFEPMHHLTFAPPKSTAPALCVAACEVVGGHWQDAIVAASAIQLMHASIYTHKHLLLSDRPGSSHNSAPGSVHGSGPTSKTTSHGTGPMSGPMSALGSGPGIKPGSGPTSDNISVRPYGARPMSETELGSGFMSETGSELGSGYISRPESEIIHMYKANIELLTGDGIMPFAFELLAGCDGVDSEKVLRVVIEISRAVGAPGMVAGEYDGVVMVKELHGCGAACGAIMGGGTVEEVERLRRFGEYVGKMKVEGVGMENWERLRGLALKELEGFDGKRVEKISSIVGG